jgi:hypothetical protein
MRHIVAVITLCLLTVATLASSQPNSIDLCNWQSKAPPDLLKGNQGTSPKDTYWFAHLSDVDRERAKNYYIFAIRNNHSVAYLPAEWLRSNGQAQVNFQRIAPEGCAANDFETSRSFKEDPKAIINYGPAKQNGKEAPLYQAVASPQQEKRGPRLKSRIIADVQDEAHNKVRINLEFTTEAEGGQFTYAVTNRGTKGHLFAIPTFLGVWEKIRRSTNIKYDSRWATRGESFLAPNNNEAQRQIVRVEGVKDFQEQLLQVRVSSTEGETMATGRIILYLPVVR